MYIYNRIFKHYGMRLYIFEKYLASIKSFNITVNYHYNFIYNFIYRKKP